MADRLLQLCAAALVPAAAGVLAAGCSDDGSGPAAGSTTAGSTSGAVTSSGSSSAAVSSGTFDALTHNVAGLPQLLSSSDPIQNTPQISPKLNAYDLVLAQEDFTYHAELARDAQHPYQSQPLQQFTTVVNDGLNRFSDSPFIDFHRDRWDARHGFVSNGADAWSSKGFSVARHEVAGGVVIDVYNLHADAGGSSDDVFARQEQFRELATFLATYSAGNAVIVGGDTNLKPAKRPGDATTFTDFLSATGTADVARTIGNLPEMIDRFLFRSSARVVLTPLRWRIADEFQDAGGDPLSDHPAIHVEFAWQRVP